MAKKKYGLNGVVTFMAINNDREFSRAGQKAREEGLDGGTFLGQEDLGQSEQLTTVRSKTLLNLNQQCMMLVVRRRTQRPSRAEAHLKDNRTNGNHSHRNRCTEEERYLLHNESTRALKCKMKMNVRQHVHSFVFQTNMIKKSGEKTWNAWVVV